MTETEKFFGRAGSGKTYDLLKQLAKWLKAGIDPENIGMVTHKRVGHWVFGAYRGNFRDSGAGKYSAPKTFRISCDRRLHLVRLVRDQVWIVPLDLRSLR